MLLVAAYGCSARTSGSAPALSSARVTQPGMSCRQATRVARGALLRLGYSIDDVVPAGPGVPGKVIGHRQTGWSAATPEVGEVHRGTVTVTCSESGAELEAEVDESFMRRLALQSDFEQAVSKITENESLRARPGDDAQATGLVIEVRPLLAADAAAEFGADLSAAGITAVRVAIDNRSGRAYAFDPDELRLVSEGGTRRTSLSMEKTAARLGDYAQEQIQAKQVSAGTIEPGEKVAGFLYFPSAAYRRATLRLTDQESGEAEGFRVEF